MTECCINCKYFRNRTTDEPCNTCIEHYSYHGVMPSFQPKRTNADLCTNCGAEIEYRIPTIIEAEGNE